MTHRLDRLLPPEIRDDPERRRLALLILAFTLVIVTPGPVFDLLFLVQGKIAVSLFSVALDLAFFGVVPILWFTRSIPAATNYVLTLFTGLLASVAAMTGGPASEAVYILAAVPLIGMLGGGIRWGAGWLAVVAGVPLTLGGLALAGIDFPVDPLVQQQITTTFGSISNYVTMFGVVVVFEQAQRRARRETEAREADLRRILDHSGQGFLTVRRTGEILGPSSAVLSQWIGAARPGQTLAAYLAAADPMTSACIALGFDALVDGFLPDALVLDQMPGRVRVGARVLSLVFRPIPDSTDLLLILSDVTADLARERNEEIEREMADVADRALRDPRGLELLIEEGETTLARLREGAGPDALRLVHTVKGSASLFGAASVARRCHEIESRLVDDPSVAPNGEELTELEETWRAFVERASLLVRRREGVVEVPRAVLDRLREELRAGRASAGQMLATVDAWVLDPADRAFARLADHARIVANRLGKSVEIDIDAETGTPPELAPFWSVAIHLVRNAVDHGLEAPEARIAAGKRPVGQIRLSSRQEGGGVVLRFTDDGRGVDWDGVARAARRRGVPCDSASALVDALFADQVSTRSEVSDLSGRGVGLAAVRQVVDQLGGTISVTSVTGVSTAFEVRLPLRRAERTLKARAAPHDS